jgi:hypothetical protein
LRPLLTRKRLQILGHHNFRGIPNCRLFGKPNHSTRFSHTADLGQYLVRQAVREEPWLRGPLGSMDSSTPRLGEELAIVSSDHRLSNCFKDEPSLGSAEAGVGGCAADGGAELWAGVGTGAGVSEGVQVGAGPPPNQLLTQV